VTFSAFKNEWRWIEERLENDASPQEMEANGSHLYLRESLLLSEGRMRNYHIYKLFIHHIFFC